MEIEWKSEKVEPYLFRKVGEWPGVLIHRAKVAPGRMLEHSNTFHEINIAISGALTTQKLSANGKLISTKGSSGNLCITPAGQSISAFWEKRLDNMMIILDPAFIDRAASENGISSRFEFAEVYKQTDPLIQQLGLTLLEESESATPSGRLFSDSVIQTLTLHLLNHYGTSQPLTKSANYRYRLITPE